MYKIFISLVLFTKLVKITFFHFDHRGFYISSVRTFFVQRATILYIWPNSAKLRLKMSRELIVCLANVYAFEYTLQQQKKSKQWLAETKKTGLYDIKWSMIDKSKYYPLTVANMFVIRSMLYPLTLVRTRLQAQTADSVYKGTYHALRTISRLEGYSALYKGFWVNSFQAFPHVLYITSYEKVRQQVSLLTGNVYLIAFAGGGVSSIFAQSLSVPIDVLSQHMQLIGQKSVTPLGQQSTTTAKISALDRIHVPERLNRANTYSIVKYLSSVIYKNEGPRGFYRGYFLSTFLVSFNSSLWWPFYYFYQSNRRFFCWSI